MKIDIVSSVNIEVTQSDIEEMIIAKIKAYDPSIHVDSMEFIQRRNPSRMDVSVSAHYGDNKPSVPEDTVSTEEQQELPLESEDTEEVETPKDTAPLFNIPSS